MTDKIFVDGPMHPDMFDGETPIRMEVPLDELGLKVYKVECTYYVEEKETHFVVAPDESKAEDLAWDKIYEDQTSLDSAEVEEIHLDSECKDFLGRNRNPDGTTQTARELLVKHIEENGCTLTPN